MLNSSWSSSGVSCRADAYRGYFRQRGTEYLKIFIDNAILTFLSPGISFSTKEVQDIRSML